MANEIALTADAIAVVYPERAEIYDFIAAEAITRGQALFLDSNGKVELADANAAGEQQFRGIALNPAGAGQAVSVLKRGHVYGYTVSAMAYNDPVYLSDSVGSLSTAVGTMTVNCGRVVPLPDASLTKVIYIDADWLRAWS